MLRGIKFHTTQHQNLRQNIATVPGICFILATIAPNSVPFWTSIFPFLLVALMLTGSVQFKSLRKMQIWLKTLILMGKSSKMAPNSERLSPE